MQHTEKYLDQMKGAIYGLLIGDAVGVPYEFNPPQNLPAYDQIDMITPANFQKTYPTIPFGTWSDDGAQALCLLDSLLYKNKLDPEDFLHRMCNWYQHGYMAVDYKVFDVGGRTAEVIRHWKDQLRGQEIVDAVLQRLFNSDAK